MGARSGDCGEAVPSSPPGAAGGSPWVCTGQQVELRNLLSVFWAPVQPGDGEGQSLAPALLGARPIVARRYEGDVMTTCPLRPLYGLAVTRLSWSDRPVSSLCCRGFSTSAAMVVRAFPTWKAAEIALRPSLLIAAERCLSCAGVGCAGAIEGRSAFTLSAGTTSAPAACPPTWSLRRPVLVSGQLRVSAGSRAGAVRARAGASWG